MVDALNSYAKTLVLYTWIDLSLSPFFMHMHLVFDAMFVCLFVCLSLPYFKFSLKKREKILKNTKTECVCVYWYLCTLDGL